MTDLYIQRADVLTPFERIEHAGVAVSGGRIERIDAGPRPAPPGARVIDAGGLLLAPGLIDLQINGAFGKDFTEDPGSIWDVARGLPRWGVTAFLPTVITSPLETVNEAIRVMKAGAPAGFKGAAPLGLHLEGPFLNPAKKGAHNPRYLLAPDASVVRNWSPQNGVRLATLAPELPGALEMIRVLKANGVVVSVGHTTATFEQASEAFQAGASYGTHLFNAMLVLEHRSPNLPGAILTTEGITAGIIADGIHTHPAIVKLAWKLKGGGELTLVTDAMAALGMDPGSYILGDYEVTVDERSARLKDGTLAGSILRPDEALRNLIAFTGCSLQEALPAMTSTPARLLGLADRGRVAQGAAADLALFTPDGRVVLTVAAGEVVFSEI